MSRATARAPWGRRSMPPLDCGSVSAGTEPRRERPHLSPRSVTPRAAQGSFTSRFRVLSVRVSMWGGSVVGEGHRAASLRAGSCASFEPLEMLASQRMPTAQCGQQRCRQPRLDRPAQSGHVGRLRTRRRAPLRTFPCCRRAPDDGTSEED
jgi:hypothetical protein